MSYSEITIDEPVTKVIDDPDFLEERVIKSFSTFKAVGSNIFGIRRRAIAANEVVDPRKGNISVVHELGPTGISPYHFTSNTFHVLTSGVPHRVPNSFGYWHVNDMEELILKVPGAEGELGYSFLIMGRPTGRSGESFAWYCDQCLTLIYEQRVATGRYGLGEFWRMEREAVKTYNADPKLRKCPECGRVNPLGYAWNPSKDTPEEAAARREW
jgi:hypothetical protein